MTRRTALLSIALIGALRAAPLPTPEQFAGFRMGADSKLVRWDRIVEYMRLAASEPHSVGSLTHVTSARPKQKSCWPVTKPFC